MASERVLTSVPEWAPVEAWYLTWLAQARTRPHYQRYLHGWWVAIRAGEEPLFIAGTKEDVYGFVVDTMLVDELVLVQQVGSPL